MRKAGRGGAAGREWAQICRESRLCGPETRRRASPVAVQVGSHPRGLTPPSTGGADALRSIGKAP